MPSRKVKHQPHKMVKHTQTICRLLSMFDQFVRLGWKGLKNDNKNILLPDYVSNIIKSGFHYKYFRNLLFLTFMLFLTHFKGTVTQIDKELINGRLHVSKYPENFTFQLFIIFQ